MTSMFWILMSSSAQAVPTDFVASVDLDATASDMHVAAGGELAAFVSGAQILVLDLETWETTTVAGCSGATPLASYDRGSAWAFYAGCSDGTVVVVEIDDDSHQVSLGEALSVAPDQSLLAVTVAEQSTGGQLYALAAQDSGNPQVYLGLQDGSGAFEAYSDALGVSGVDFTLLLNSYWMVWHGGRQMSKIALSNGVPSILSPTVTNTDYLDACAPNGVNDTAFAADDGTSGGRILTVLPAQTDTEVAVTLSGIETPLELACSSSTLDGDWVASLHEDTLDVREYVNTAITTEPLVSFDLSALGLPVLEELEASPGYLLGLADGSVYIFSDRPWLSIDVVQEGPYLDTDVIDVNVTSDTEGSYALHLGTETGEELAAGDFVEGAASFSLSLADVDLDEGNNRLFLVQGEGRVAVDLNVDTPPDQPVVSLGFEDATILVEVGGSDEGDLATYEVYVSTVAFESGDLPEFEGDDEIENPLEFTVDEPGSSQTLRVEGVTNYQTYYVGVRALDDSGTEGPMSEIQTVTPEPTFSASQLANEPGGFGCNSSSGAAGLFGVALAGLALLRRRRRGLSLGALLLASSPALAQDSATGSQEIEQDDSTQSADSDERHMAWTEKSKSNHLRVGPAQMDGGNTDSVNAWDTVYGGQITMVELGGSYQFFRFLSADARLGLMRKQGNQAAGSGSTSTAETRMSVLPVGVGATLRLDPFLPRRQLGDDVYVGMPIVPWVSGSLDYYPWLERKGSLDVENLTAFERSAGGKAGYSWAVGGDILLDWMDPKRASLAEARWGIVDTYFTVSYRQSSLFNDEGLSFAGSTLSFGLKIDRK